MALAMAGCGSSAASSGSASVSGSASGSASAEAKEGAFKIGIIQLVEHDALDKAREGFIDNYKEDFGLRWLFLHMNIHPNAYYNYLKKTRTNYHRQKKAILNTIRDIYHECNGKK